MNEPTKCTKTEIICYTTLSSVFELLIFFTASLSMYLLVRHSDKGGFPLSRNFYVRTHLNFTRVNKIEAMYKRSRVNVEFYPRSTFTFYAWPLIHYLYVIYASKFFVRSQGKITPQSQPLTQYNIQKQRINQIETEDTELNIFPFSGEVRERDSTVYVLV